jgi:hypothetical protein
MKKIVTMLMLAIFVVGMLPAVMAQQEGKPDTAGSDDAPTPVLISAGETVRESIQNLKQTALRVMTRAQDIKDYQKEKLQIALRMCQEDAEDSGTCQEQIQERLRLVENLGEEALQQLQNIEARKVQAMEKIKEMKDNEELRKFKVKIGNELKARIISQGDVEAARVKYNGAQMRYENAVMNYDSAKAGFDAAKAAFAACQSDCDQLEADVKEQAKAYMLTVVERIREQLNKAGAKVEETAELTDEEAAESETAIEAELADINVLEDEVEAITEDTTKEDISALALKIKNKWADETRDEVVRTAGFLQAAKMGGVHVQLRQLSQKMESTMAKMAEQGIDTSAVESLVDDFNTKLGSVEATYLGAVAKYKEASAAGETQARKGALTQAQTQMRAANQGLVQARETLRSMVQQLRAQNSLDELEEDESDEVIASEEADIENGDSVEVVIEDDTATVTVEIDGEEETFTVESTDVEDIQDEISQQTTLDEETVDELTEIEVQE